MKLAFPALLLAATFTSNALANEPVVAPEALANFLSGVRDFAGGRLTPGPLYDPQSVSTPSGNGAVIVIPVVASNVQRQASWRSGNGRYTGITIGRSTITPTRSVGQSVRSQQVTTMRSVSQQRR